MYDILGDIWGPSELLDYQGFLSFPFLFSFLLLSCEFLLFCVLLAFFLYHIVFCLLPFIFIPSHTTIYYSFLLLGQVIWIRYVSKFYGIDLSLALWPLNMMLAHIAYKAGALKLLEFLPIDCLLLPNCMHLYEIYLDV